MDRWYHKRVQEIGWYLSMVQSVVINFSSKVYSKSLLKGLKEKTLLYVINGKTL